MTPALFAVESLVSVAVVSAFSLAPFVGPLPASSVDTAPFVGPLPASAFGCANAGTDRPRPITATSKLLPTRHVKRSLGTIPPGQLDLITASSGWRVAFRRWVAEPRRAPAGAGHCASIRGGWLISGLPGALGVSRPRTAAPSGSRRCGPSMRLRAVAIERSLRAFAIPFDDVTPPPLMASIVAARPLALSPAAAVIAFTARPFPYRRK